MRLLVVEDEPRIAELLRTAFGRAGFVTDTVATCADACATLPLNPYDAAILDLRLPDGDGLAVIGEARRAGNPIPILMLTARDAIEDRVGGLDAGGDDYLVKPFAMSDLSPAPRRCCGSRAALSAPCSRPAISLSTPSAATCPSTMFRWPCRGAKPQSSNT